MSSKRPASTPSAAQVCVTSAVPYELAWRVGFAFVAACFAVIAHAMDVRMFADPRYLAPHGGSVPYINPPLARPQGFAIARPYSFLKTHTAPPGCDNLLVMTTDSGVVVIARCKNQAGQLMPAVLTLETSVQQERCGDLINVNGLLGCKTGVESVPGAYAGPPSMSVRFYPSGDWWRRCKEGSVIVDPSGNAFSAQCRNNSNENWAYTRWDLTLVIFHPHCTDWRASNGTMSCALEGPYSQNPFIHKVSEGNWWRSCINARLDSSATTLYARCRRNNGEYLDTLLHPLSNQPNKCNKVDNVDGNLTCYFEGPYAQNPISELKELYGHWYNYCRDVIYHAGWIYASCHDDTGFYLPATGINIAMGVELQRCHGIVAYWGTLLCEWNRGLRGQTEAAPEGDRIVNEIAENIDDKGLVVKIFGSLISDTAGSWEHVWPDANVLPGLYSPGTHINGDGNTVGYY